MVSRAAPRHLPFESRDPTEPSRLSPGQKVSTRRNLLASYLLAASLYKIDDDIRLGPAARAPVSRKC